MKHCYVGTDALTVHVKAGGINIAPGMEVDLDAAVAQGVTLRDATHPLYAPLFVPVTPPAAQAQTTEPKRRGRATAAEETGDSQQEG